MTVKEIIEQELKNKNSIYLLKEGIFWRVYNQSAMRLCSYLQSYKVNVKYIKKVQQDLYYCGFPDAFLDKIIQKAKEKGYETNQINEKQIEIKNIANDSINYDEWRNTHNKAISIAIVSEPPEEYQEKKGKTEALEKIREFQLENSTPIQTMLFVQQLKQMIP